MAISDDNMRSIEQFIEANNLIHKACGILKEASGDDKAGDYFLDAWNDTFPELLGSLGLLDGTIDRARELIEEATS